MIQTKQAVFKPGVIAIAVAVMAMSGNALADSKSTGIVNVARGLAKGTEPRWFDPRTGEVVDQVFAGRISEAVIGSSISVSPASIMSCVLFPQPDGPMIDTNSPSSTFRLISFSKNVRALPVDTHLDICLSSIIVKPICFLLLFVHPTYE